MKSDYQGTDHRDDDLNDLHKPRDRCGCHGGCAFFGNNSQGADFFDTDHLFNVPCGVASMKVIKVFYQCCDDNIMILYIIISLFQVIPCVNTDPSKDVGYGQSILHKQSLVFDLPNPLAHPGTKRKGTMLTY